MSPTLKFFQ